MSEEHNSTTRESDPFGRVDELWRDVRPIEWAVIVGSAVAGRGCITYVDPRFGETTVRVTRDLLIGCAPRQPHSVHRHARANLSLAHQGLVCPRETLVDFGMLRDARVRGS